MLPGKRDFAHVIKNLEMGDYPKLSGEVQCNENAAFQHKAMHNIRWLKLATIFNFK